jgi:hypothetical protein
MGPRTETRRNDQQQTDNSSGPPSRDYSPANPQQSWRMSFEDWRMKFRKVLYADSSGELVMDDTENDRREDATNDYLYRFHNSV